MGHGQRTNPMGCYICLYKGPILGNTMRVTKEPDACAKDQSYATVHVATSTVSNEGSTKDQLYGNSTCKKSSCQKEYWYRGYVQ